MSGSPSRIGGAEGPVFGSLSTGGRFHLAEYREAPEMAPHLARRLQGRSLEAPAPISSDEPVRIAVYHLDDVVVRQGFSLLGVRVG